jgi:hypothetical protein
LLLFAIHAVSRLCLQEGGFPSAIDPFIKRSGRYAVVANRLVLRLRVVDDEFLCRREPFAGAIRTIIRERLTATITVYRPPGLSYSFRDAL